MVALLRIRSPIQVDRIRLGYGCMIRAHVTCHKVDIEQEQIHPSGNLAIAKLGPKQLGLPAKTSGPCYNRAGQGGHPNGARDTNLRQLPFCTDFTPYSRGLSSFPPNRPHPAWIPGFSLMVIFSSTFQAQLWPLHYCGDCAGGVHAHLINVEPNRVVRVVKHH